MSDALPKHVVVVLGMHRSGTSALTKGLEVLGIDLGDSLLAARPDNQKGYFEDGEVTALDEDILGATGRYWHSLPPLAAEELEDPALLPFVERAVALMQEKLAETPVFGLKDPRISRLLPLWQRVFARLGVRVSYIIASRNPLSVISSVVRRDKFPPRPVYTLWLEHMLACLRHTGGWPRLVVDFDRLMDDPARELGRIATAFALPFDSDGAAFTDYKNEFLEGSLRHGHYAEADIRNDPDAGPVVADFYRTLREMAEDRLAIDDPAVAATLAAVDARVWRIPESTAVGPAFFDILDPANQAPQPAVFPAVGGIDGVMPVDEGRETGITGWARDLRSGGPVAGFLVVGARKRYLSIIPTRRPDVPDHGDAAIGFFSVIPGALIRDHATGLRLYAVTADGMATPLRWFGAHPAVPPLRLRTAAGGEQVVSPQGRIFHRHPSGAHPLPTLGMAREGGDLRGLWFDYPAEGERPAALAVFVGENCVAYTEIAVPTAVLVLMPRATIDGQRLRIVTLWADGQFGLSLVLPLDVTARLVGIRHRL